MSGRLYEPTRDYNVALEQQIDDSKNKEQCQITSLAQVYKSKALKNLEMALYSKQRYAENLREEAVHYLYEAEAIEPGCAMFELAYLGTPT